MIMASRLGPAHPRATAWNGAGAWLIFSQSRQLNFSRTVSITFHWRGTTFQRPRHVLAEFAQAIAAAAFASCRRIDHHPFARKMLGEGLALGALARKSAHRRRPGDSPFRRQFVFGRVGFQLFERQRQLLDQPR